VIAKGIAAQIGPKVFQPEIARVTTEVNDINRKVLHSQLRNLLTLTVVGGNVETLPPPVGETQFTAVDISVLVAV
jgi:hypothetical protein